MMYRKDLDVLKGISILAVVLFHMGLLKTGYLGVDAFLVINGFLVVPSVYRNITNETFSFLQFMEKRIVRLLPLVIFASIASLILGYYVMMPDHYENLSQSVIAANLMSTNILSSITTRDYWNTVNDYKPLMHLWYVGIIFEFYVILPILFLFSRKIAKRFNLNVSSFIKRTLVFTTLISLGWYLMPDKMVGDKFYLITTRFFELGLGGMIGLNIITPPLLATKEIDKNIFSDLTYIAPSRFFI